MNKSFKISKLIIKLWAREMNKLMRDKWKKTLAISLFLLLLVMAGLSGYQLTKSILDSFLSGDYRSLMLLVISMLINTSIFSFLLFILFKAVTPEQDHFDLQIRWFPIRAFERQFGYYLPFVLAITVLVLFLMLIILLPAFINKSLSILFIMVFFVTVFVQSLFTLSIIQGIYHLIYALLKWFRVPFSKHLTLFFIILVGLQYGISTFDINTIIQSYQDFQYNLFYIATPIILLVIEEAIPMNVNILLVVTIIGIGCFFPIIALFFPIKQAEPLQWKFLSSVKAPKGKFSSMMLKELKSQIRNEDNVLMFLMIFVLLIVTRFYFDFSNQEYIPFLLAGMTGLTALNSYGNDMQMFKLYRMYDLHIGTILFSKLSALWMLSIFQFLVYYLIFIGISGSFSQIIISLVILINATMILYLLGTIIPVHKTNPFMGLVSFSTLILVMIPLIFLLNQIIVSFSFMLKVIFILFIELLLAWGVWSLTRWRLRYD